MIRQLCDWLRFDRWRWYRRLCGGTWVLVEWRGKAWWVQAEDDQLLGAPLAIERWRKPWRSD